MCRVHWRPFRISFAPLDVRQLLLIAGKARRDQAHQLLDADRDIALVEELGNLGLGHALLHCFTVVHSMMWESSQEIGRSSDIAVARVRRFGPRSGKPHARSAMLLKGDLGEAAELARM